MKQLTGVITSLSGKKTVRVSVERRWTHPLYQKSVKRSKNYACHCEQIGLKVGDKVKIESSKPYSKMKRFRVVEEKVKS